MVAAKKKVFREFIKILLKEKPKDKDKINSIKLRLARKYGLEKFPTDIEILSYANKKEFDVLSQILLTKPTRTLSGVSVCAIMTKPSPCPHGRCVFCPGGVNSAFGDVPQSYTGREPASMRAKRNDYDSYLQVMNRLEQYVVMGHNFNKIELIIMGGTFPSLNFNYQRNFVAYAFKAMNDFSRLFIKGNSFKLNRFREFFLLPGSVNDEERVKTIKRRLSKLKGFANLELEQEYNDKKSKVKCVGLTIETRPDYARLEHAKRMLSLGATRVELGVQTIYNDVLEKVERGHTVEDSIAATRILKDLGFKINYHIMIGLPNSNYKRDYNIFKELFENEDFRPDMLKIYPCLVVKGTKLYQWWKNGKFKEANNEYALKLLKEVYPIIPEYVRVMRIQRDIPSHTIESGVNLTNLRQVLYEELKNKPIKEIRFREIGLNLKQQNLDLKGINRKIFVKEYNASKGKEFFISEEDEQRRFIFGFCRLRFPSQSLIKEIDDKTALIRELHVYGPSEKIGLRGNIQHSGTGSRLLKKAEQIAKARGMRKILVISGIGVRAYYRKHGYKKQSYYMAKHIS